MQTYIEYYKANCTRKFSKLPSFYTPTPKDVDTELTVTRANDEWIDIALDNIRMEQQRHPPRVFVFFQ